jgi:hypothetical protein
MYKTIAFVASLMILAGCAGRPSLIPNSDKNLRRTSAQFAADAAKRHPYKSNAPRGGEAVARAEVGYMLKQITIVNLSQEAWNDVEVWVNRKYVVDIPTMEPNQVKTINFQMLFDDKGNYFPTDNKKVLVSKVEVLKDGKMFDVPVRLGD